MYALFLENVEEIRKIIYIDVDFGPEGAVEAFLRNNALWHRSYHQKLIMTNSNENWRGEEKMNIMT